MSAGPRIKRQFAGAASDPAQRQITAFFNKTSRDSPPSSNNAQSSSSRTTESERAPLNGPTLPAHIQSNLLSVGMRVRKSVPEGYKTGSTYSGFSLWSDSDSHSGTNGSDARPVHAVPSIGGVRELTPFCGIHKVGGLAVQPLTTDYPPSGLKSMPSSQESIMSNSSVTSAMAATSQAAMNRKRFFVTEEEEQAAEKEDDDLTRYTSGWFPEQGKKLSNNNSIWRNRDDWLDGEISPRSLVPAEWGEDMGNGNRRVMAVPKRRIGTPKSNGNGNGLLLPPGAPVSAGSDQENMVVDDFEDASFLDYRIGGGNGVDMDLE